PTSTEIPERGDVGTEMKPSGSEAAGAGLALPAPAGATGSRQHGEAPQAAEGRGVGRARSRAGDLHLTAKIICNLPAIIVLFYAANDVSKTLPYGNPCVAQLRIVLPLTASLFFLAHFMWRNLSAELGRSIAVIDLRLLKIDTRALVGLLNKLS